MKKPKTIKLYLVDGEPTGIRTAELSNWDGKAIVIPRNRMKSAKDREEVQSPAVYLLVGAEDNDELLKVYVGEAETVMTRLAQHETNKDFWQYAVAFISKSNNLTKAHVKFLESHIIETLSKSGRCRLENHVSPNKVNLPESDQSDMIEFIENLELLTGALGWNFFRQSSSVTTAEKIKYYCSGPSAKAEGFMDDEGFIVLKDSYARSKLVESAKAGWVPNIHQKLLSNNILRKEGDSYYFTQDYLFNSPSAAAAAILACHANGWTVWKTKDGQTLSQIEREELKEGNDQ